MHFLKSSSINNTMKGQKENCQIRVFVLNFSIYRIPRAGFITIGGECFQGHPGSGKCGHLHFETQNCMFLQLLSYQLSGDSRLSSSWLRDSTAEWFSLVTEIIGHLTRITRRNSQSAAKMVPQLGDLRFGRK